MVMFKKIIFWCEFPEQVKDWKATDKLLKKIKIPVEVYTGVQSVNEYRKWKKKTRIPMYPWPLLSRKEGYWFSGFSSKKSIDKLKQYKGIKMKIDLEPPIPPWSYTTPKIVMFAVKKNPNVMFSIGLIGTGALKKEGTYRKVKEFKEDLRMIEKSGCNEVAVYSLESVLKRSNPEEWINAINEFV